MGLSAVFAVGLDAGVFRFGEGNKVSWQGNTVYVRNQVLMSRSSRIDHILCNLLLKSCWQNVAMT